MVLYLKLVAAIALCFTASCANTGYVISEYGKTKVVKYEAPEQTIRVFDIPEKQKMMVTPTLGKAAAMGAGSGATLFIWNPGMEVGPMQKSAQHYLDSTGRNVEITSGRLLMKPQWEFLYEPRKYGQ